jgi:hypothetical protein
VANLKAAVNASQKVERKVLAKYPKVHSSSSLRSVASKPRMLPKPSSAASRPGSASSSTKKAKAAANNQFTYKTIYGEKRTKAFKDITGENMFNMNRKNQERYMLKKMV